MQSVPTAARTSTLRADQPASAREAAIAVAPDDSRARDQLVVWRFVDGKPGHDKQSLGLVNALKRRVPTTCVDLPPLSTQQSLAAMVSGKFEAGPEQPNPDFIVGSGHPTHMSLLAARRCIGGHSVVLMRPSLPISLFDLAVIPRHDGVTERDRVLVTHGVVNNSRPATGPRHPQRGLILIGGPSRHYRWDTDRVVQQILTLSQRTPDIDWQLSTSRRSPADVLPALHGAKLTNVNFHDGRKTATDWLDRELAACRCAWITPDSASMVYEALSAGAACGVFELLPRGNSRISRSIDELVRNAEATRFTDWLAGRPVVPRQHVLDEAGRTADWLLAKWRSDA